MKSIKKYFPAVIISAFLSGEVMAQTVGYAGVSDKTPESEEMLFEFEIDCNSQDNQSTYDDSVYEFNQTNDESSDDSSCDYSFDADWAAIYDKLFGPEIGSYQVYLGGTDDRDDIRLQAVNPDTGFVEPVLSKNSPSFARASHYNHSAAMAMQVAGTEEVMVANVDYNGVLRSPNLIGARTDHRPDIAFFKGRYYVTYTGTGSQDVYVARQTLGFNGPSELETFSHKRLSGKSSNHPNFAVFNDKLYIFYRGHSSKSLWYVYSSDGVNWSKQYKLPNGAESSKSPYPTVMGDTLYLFYKGGSSNNLWFSKLTEGNNWSSQKRLPGSLQTSAGPGAMARNGELFVFFRGQSSERVLYTTSIDGGFTWSDLIATGARTSGSLSSIGYSSSGAQVTPPEPTPVVLPDLDDEFWDMIGRVMP